MQPKIEVLVTPVSVEVGTHLSIEFSSDVPISPGNVGWSVGHVTLEDTAFILGSSGVTVPCERGVRVDCAMTDDLEPGIYVLSHSGILPEGVPIELRFGPYSEELHVFEIRAVGADPRDSAAIMQEFHRLIEQREADFHGGIGVGANSYQIFVFVKGCLLTTPMRLSRFEVSPMNRLGLSDEIGAIEGFFGADNLVIRDWAERAHTKSLGDHAYAMHFPNVRGSDFEDATNTAIQECRLLTSLYSLKRGGAGDLFGCHIIDRTTGEARAAIFTRPYRGNLLGGFISGESPDEIRTALERLRASETLRLYVELFREARREQNIEVEVFRYWNLLESIARSKRFVGMTKLDWAGNVRRNRRNQPMKIGDSAEELVFELLRQAFAATCSEASLIGRTDGSTLSEQLTVWYRRRNCVVHGGDCLCRNIGSPRSEVKYVRCKEERQKAEDIGDDLNLRAIRSVTERILNLEIHH